MMLYYNDNFYDYSGGMGDNDDQNYDAHDIYVHDGNFILVGNAFGLHKLWFTKSI